MNEMMGQFELMQGRYQSLVSRNSEMTQDRAAQLREGSKLVEALEHLEEKHERVREHSSTLLEGLDGMRQKNADLD